MAKRNLYLKTTSVEESLEKYLAELKSAGALEPRSETVSAYEALARKTFGAVYARCCSPLFNASAMDGIAVTAKATRFASEEKPLTLKRGRDYKIVDTGDPIKQPFDAVVMAEDVREIDDDTVQITEAASGWQHVRPIGEDIVKGELIIPTDHVLRAVDLGVLLASGNTEVVVYKRPRVGIIPTGTELIEPNEQHKEGDIIDSNSGMFAALCVERGAEPKRYPIVRDDFELIKRAVEKAVAENDVVLVSAGSSAGTEDFTKMVLDALGKVVIHGVSMKPGKPVILAEVSGKAVIGLPGYPVSAYLAFESFVAPVLKELLGKGGKEERHTVRATLTKRLVSSLKHREYVRVKVGEVADNRFVASPLNRGAGAAMSLVRADGFLVIPQNCEGFEAGSEAEIELYKDEKEIRATLVSVGSHDLILDLIGELMFEKDGKTRMSSTHVGSMAGLMALSRGETVLAPTHLLDEESGVYNVSYLKKLFNKGGVSLIKGVGRIQGIMVKRGNPLGIKGIEDLTRVRFVNRQRGAGTRVLFDFLLNARGIFSSEIDGYDKEVATHMAVAALVLSEEADAGLGVFSAASAMGLDFIPVGEEDYDFAIRTENLQNEKVKTFIEVLKSQDFERKLNALGGYTLKRTGEIIDIDG